MKKGTKRKILVASSALTLAGTLTGVFTAVDGDQDTTRHPGAAAPTNGVRAQHVDLQNNPSNASTGTDTPQPANRLAVTHVLIRVKNYGAFVGKVCVDNDLRLAPEDTDDDPPHQPLCTDGIPVLKEETLDSSPQDLDPNNTGPVQAKVHGYAFLGGDKEIDTAVDGKTHCFRFDGTTLDKPVRFTEVSDCANL